MSIRPTAAAKTAIDRTVHEPWTCDLYGIPLLVLVDTPGFLPGRSMNRNIPL